MTAPDDLGERTEGFHHLLNRRHTGFQIAAVWRDRYMPELPVCGNFGKLRKHRCRIFRTEGDQIDHRGIDTVAGDLLRIP